MSWSVCAGRLNHGHLETVRTSVRAKRRDLEADRTNTDTYRHRAHLAGGQNGNVTRAMSWTWRVLKRREPGKYRRWMTRLPRANTLPEALKQLAED